MYVYTAYNLCIHSEIRLPELVICEGSPDVIVSIGKSDSCPQATSDRGHYFRGEISDVGVFWVREGREILVNPISGLDESSLRPYILGPALSVLLRQRGLLVLHASSVAIADGAVAFIGGSGWGKSTLAEAFHSRGYSILTDDVMGINTETVPATVLPGFPQIKLWPEAAAAIGHNPESLPILHPGTEKLAHHLTRGFGQTPLPLKRIYVLAGGSHHAITRLHPQAAFAEVVRHSREVRSLQESDFASSHLRQCASLVNQVPICRFQRQRSLAALPELVQLVEDDLAQAITHQAGSRQLSEACSGSL